MKVYSDAELVNYYVHYKDIIKPTVDSNPTKYVENAQLLKDVEPMLEELLNRDISDFLILKVTEALILCKEY